ncbi:MAG: hypothetical protein LAP13_20575 [Acidobacteriia bacterium]|nr:hypothetical protein [Terriglobia bacterium]
MARAENIQADEGALSILAQAAEGSLRDALSLLDQVIAACAERLEEARVRQVLGVVPAELLAEMVEAIHAADARRVLDRVGQLAAEGYELAHFCGEFTKLVRNLMVARSCGADSPLLQVPPRERERLKTLAGLFGEEDLARFFQILLRAESEMRYALQPRFHLEMALMKLVYARRLAPLESLLSELSRSSVEKPAGGAPRTSTAQPPQPLPAKTREAAPPVEALRAVAPAPNSAPVAPATSSPAAPPPAIAVDARLASIKARLFDQSKKFLSSCLEHVSGWRFEDGEVKFLYAPKDALYAELLRSREQQEALRAACAQVLGQPVRICVTLEEQGAETHTASLSARERAERDAGVEAFRKTFGCTLVEVQDLSQE